MSIATTASAAAGGRRGRSRSGADRRPADRHTRRRRGVAAWIFRTTVSARPRPCFRQGHDLRTIRLRQVEPVQPRGHPGEGAAAGQRRRDRGQAGTAGARATLPAVPPLSDAPPRAASQLVRGDAGEERLGKGERSSAEALRHVRMAGHPRTLPSLIHHRNPSCKCPNRPFPRDQGLPRPF